MKGVKFGNFHSYDTWGLILSSNEIGSPTPKKNQIEIEGSDSMARYYLPQCYLIRPTTGSGIYGNINIVAKGTT